MNEDKEKGKMVVVKTLTWKRLQQLKLKNDLPSIDAVVKMLLHQKK